MAKYIFENKEKKKLKDCTPEELKIIVDGLAEGRCEIRSANEWILEDSVESEVIKYALINGVYRVLAPQPTPNVIDWSQFPAWVKACATDNNGASYIYSMVPVWRGDSWGSPGDTKDVKISDFPDFKRGTIAPENSLLIRPIGE